VRADRPRRAVAINARAAARRELGGVERWARELTARLPGIDPGGYRVIAPPGALSHRAGHAWEQGVLPLRARRASLLLNPANLAPIAHPRNVVVIHDAAALREPGWYSSSYAALQRRLLPAVARRARLVITVSAFSRDELARLVGVDAVVVPGGVDHARFAPDVDPGPARAALGLARPYVLCVASRTARKNLGALEVTAARLASEGIELVAAGGGRPQFRAGTGPGPWSPSAVRALGHVADEHLPGLYAGALAFVLPSLHEGFGLTCLEAMASGAPVVAARAGALPQTCGPAARYADPTDPGDIAEQVVRALGDGAMRAAGLARAAEFSWERTAREIHALLEDVRAGLR
jgi:glycosyltransferase involved in cell wall biosynthesis